MNKVSLYNYLISNFDIHNEVVRIAIEAVIMLNDEQEQDLIEFLKSDYNIDIEEGK